MQDSNPDKKRYPICDALIGATKSLMTAKDPVVTAVENGPIPLPGLIPAHMVPT